MSGIYRAYLANVEAIKRIFSRHFSDAQDVEDLAQETFLNCFAAEAKTEIHEPKAFLFRAAKNLALSERKKKFRLTTDYVEDSGGSDVIIDDDAVSAEARLDSQRKLAALAEAVASLPTDYRQAFLMRKMENLKLAQIAARMNVTQRTAANRVAAALELCLIYLRKKGYDPAEFGRSLNSLKPPSGAESKSRKHIAFPPETERSEEQ